MIRDITIGQYYNRESFVHSLDPRTKIISLIIMMTAVFIADSFIQYAICALFTLAAIAASQVEWGYILKGMKPVWLLVLMTAIINLFLGGGEQVIFTWHNLTITYEAVCLAVTMAVRVVLLVALGTLLTLTTSSTSLTMGIELLLRPLARVGFPANEIAMMMSIALRFIPTLADEADKIMKAQAARGNDFESGGMLRKVRGMIPLFIPLFISAFRRADELAMAMECRCYSSSAKRTSFRVLGYKKRDAVGFVCVGLTACSVIICRIAGVFV